MNPRPAGAQVLEVRCVQFASSQVARFANADLDVDACLPQYCGALPRDLRERVEHRDDDPAYPRLNHGLRAGGSFAEVTARLECDIQSRAAGGLARLQESIDLGVRLAKLFVPTFANYASIANDDRPDQRIGLNPPAAALG